MTPFDEMKSYVRFTAEDEVCLRALWADVEPHTAKIANVFYDRILEFPSASAVFEDMAQVRRLQATLEVWVEELLTGPWDEAYYERRERIGRVHVRVGLPHRYMFTAMSVVRDELCRIAQASLPDDRSEATCSAIARVTNLDLAIMTQTFMVAHEHAQLVSLQEVIVRHLPMSVVLVDKGGRVVAATGVTPGRALATDPVGRLMHDVLPEGLSEAANLDHHVERALAVGRVISLPRVDVEGEERTRHFGLQVVPLDHPLAAFMVHVEDVTATVETEAHLRGQESLAQLGALSAGVAHELRNPLAGISGAVQVIAGSLPEDDRRRRIMEKVNDQIGRLNRLVTDLLTFARPRKPTFEIVHLREVCMMVAELVRTEHPGVAVEVEGDGQAWADADHVHRLLLNLASNGAQIQEGEGAVLMEIRGAVVRVCDDGPGVSEEVAARLFEPFFTTRTQGTGLGLAICRSSAERMEGRVDLCDQPGTLSGACFQVTLKARPEDVVRVPG